MFWKTSKASTSRTPEVEPKFRQVKQINDSLYELHRPSGLPSMQILFFHGLPSVESSHVSLSTWECGDGSSNLWPQTWLVEEFPGAHVFSVEYNHYSRYKETSIDYLIDENILLDIIEANIGQLPGCPVVLVGHSIGGLVIKSLCVHAHRVLSVSHSRQNAKIENFVQNIKGIFYYATPHHGMPFLDKAANLLDGQLFQYFKVLTVSAARLSYEFDQLHKLYSNWQIAGLGEGLPVKSGVFRGTVVVPEASSREGVFNLEEADHFSISKPPTQTSSRFRALAHMLHDILKPKRGNVKEVARPKNIQYVPGQIIGISDPLQKLKKLLVGTTSLCLIGVGGLGKTTLAKVAFNELGSEFEYTCFVSDVKLIGGSEEALKEAVWKQMYRSGTRVAGESDWSKLQGRLLLLVFDDISSERDVKVLSEITKGPSVKSRFIATSRDPHLLPDTYRVPFLNENIGEQLFISCAFPTDGAPPSNLTSLVREMVRECGGLPLLLEVIGRYLKATKQEEHWKQALQELEKLDAVTDLNKQSCSKLRLCYQGLKKNEKQVFLDATTFFLSHHGFGDKWTLREAKLAWGEAYEVDANELWQVLVDRSLVYDVKEHEVIRVHEQLRCLGEQIASESNDKCRVWEREKALELLQFRKASYRQDVHALRLLSNGRCNDKNKTIRIASPNVHKLKNLRYLQVEAPVCIDPPLQDTKCFPSNIVLLKCVGLQFLELAVQTRLVVLKLDDVHAKALPKFLGQLSALKIFRLRNASNLQSLPEEIGLWSQLELLELVCCPCLETLPKTFGQLSNLKDLRLESCNSFCTLPDSFGSLSALNCLEFTVCNNLQILPESLAELCALTRLEIRNCAQFHSLPKSFGALCALDELRIERCGKLTSLPDSFGSLPKLRRLELVRCDLQSLPESFENLFMFRGLKVRDLTLHP
ncbi:unnamed protein product [Calypogeia fissa]